MASALPHAPSILLLIIFIIAHPMAHAHMQPQNIMIHPRIIITARKAPVETKAATYELSTFLSSMHPVRFMHEASRLTASASPCSDQNSPEHALPPSLNLDKVAMMKVIKPKQLSIESMQSEHEKSFAL